MRFVIAVAVVIAVGFNRDLRDKPLGMHTLALGVACALAARMLVAAGIVLSLSVLFGLNWAGAVVAR